MIFSIDAFDSHNPINFKTKKMIAKKTLNKNKICRTGSSPNKNAVVTVLDKLTAREI